MAELGKESTGWLFLSHATRKRNGALKQGWFMIGFHELMSSYQVSNLSETSVVIRCHKLLVVEPLNWNSDSSTSTSPELFKTLVNWGNWGTIELRLKLGYNPYFLEWWHQLSGLPPTTWNSRASCGQRDHFTSCFFHFCSRPLHLIRICDLGPEECGSPAKLNIGSGQKLPQVTVFATCSKA